MTVGGAQRPWVMGLELPPLLPVPAWSCSAHACARLCANMFACSWGGSYGISGLHSTVASRPMPPAAGHEAPGPPGLLPLSSLWACTAFVIRDQLLRVDLDS